MSYFSAYALTHYSSSGHWGIGIPKSTNSKLPSDIGLEYITQRIPINQTEWLETWFIPTQSVSNGTVLLFPNAGSKDSAALSFLNRVLWLGFMLV
ncbi:MAG: hypothetical protein WCP16_15865, partial [Pseudanabaena sp. ELA645]